MWSVMELTEGVGHSLVSPEWVASYATIEAEVLSRYLRNSYPRRRCTPYWGDGVVQTQGVLVGCTHYK